MTKETDEEILKNVTERWGENNYIDKLPIPSDGRVDIEKLEPNQSVLWGDGKTYYFRLTKK